MVLVRSESSPYVTRRSCPQFDAYEDQTSFCPRTAILGTVSVHASCFSNRPRQLGPAFSRRGNALSTGSFRALSPTHPRCCHGGLIQSFPKGMHWRDPELDSSQRACAWEGEYAPDTINHNIAAHVGHMGARVWQAIAERAIASQTHE